MGGADIRRSRLESVRAWIVNKWYLGLQVGAHVILSLSESQFSICGQQGQSPIWSKAGSIPINGNEENSLLLFKKYLKTKETSSPWSAFTWGGLMSLKMLD
jgi:hypothetical protein